MQLLMQIGHEFEKTKGLSLIDGEVVSINNLLNEKLKLPFIGWYQLDKIKDKIINNINKDQWFYFVHSYMVKCNDKKNIIADTSNNISVQL